MAPRDVREVEIRIENAARTGETHEGKSKLEFDTRLPYLPKRERDYLAASSSVMSWDLQIELPAKYQDTEISISPREFGRLDERTYLLPATAPKGPVWIVFPNPSTKRFQIAQLITSLVVGTFTLLFHVPAIRDQRLGWAGLTLLLSSTVLVFAGYFTFSLAKATEFAVYAAVSVPHALFGLLASCYIILARRFQVSITGLVTIEGASAEFATVSLVQIQGTDRRPVKQADQLREGRYLFHTWVRRREGVSYQIAASTTGTDAAASDVLKAERSQKYEVPVLALHRTLRVQQDNASAAQPVQARA